MTSSPGLDEGLDGAEQRLGGAGGDGDLRRRVDAPAVEALGLAGDLLAQCRRSRPSARTGCGRRAGGARRARAARRGAAKSGKSLGQVDGAVLGRELGHHREDRGADVGQLAGEPIHGAGRFCLDPVAHFQPYPDDSVAVSVKGLTLRAGSPIIAAGLRFGAQQACRRWLAPGGAPSCCAWQVSMTEAAIPPAGATNPSSGSGGIVRRIRCWRSGLAKARALYFPDRPEPAHDDRAPPARAGRRLQHQRADHRRVRHRQGMGGALHPRALAAPRPALRARQLRRHPGRPAGKRAVRSREGRFHRRHRHPGRPFRGGRGRHACSWTRSAT